MPNFIHSLDAANVHLLLLAMYNKSLPVYTIHDCFAGTPNNMKKMEKLVKKAFIDIYFDEDGYLLKLHKHFVTTIISATDSYHPVILTEKGIVAPENNNFTNLKDINVGKANSLNNIEKVINRNTKEVINIPTLPNGYMERNAQLEDFIKGLFNSKYATLPSISLAIYGYWFKDNKHSIKMIKGPLEN